MALFSLIGGARKYAKSDYITAFVATFGMIVYNIEEVILQKPLAKKF